VEDPEEETETSRTTKRVLKVDPQDSPEAVVDAVMVPAEVRPVNPERETTSAVTATPKVTSPETAPSPRRREHPEREEKVVPEEAEVETANPEKRETTNAETVKEKVTSLEIAPSPRRSAPRDPSAPSLPVPPLVRPAETATRKVTSPEIAPPPRRREHPVKIDPPESPGHATTAVKKDISPETAPKPRRNPRPPKVVRLRKSASPEAPSLMKITMMVKKVSTVKISPLTKPAEPRRKLAPSSEPRPPLRSPRKLTQLPTRLASPPALTTS
jgi:hypothetical protein